MSITARLSFAIVPSMPTVPLGVEVWLNGHKIFNQEHASQAEMFTHDISEQDGEHVLQIVLKHKLPAHTQIDSDNNIVSDASININDFMFEDIDVRQIVYDIAEYQHDFNGHGPAGTHKFYGNMGCNGTVTVKFSTPIYLWLLEKM
jgi:hypothetical protein